MVFVIRKSNAFTNSQNIKGYQHIFAGWWCNQLFHNWRKAYDYQCVQKFLKKVQNQKCFQIFCGKDYLHAKFALKKFHISLILFLSLRIFLMRRRRQATRAGLESSVVARPVKRAGVEKTGFFSRKKFQPPFL